MVRSRLLILCPAIVLTMVACTQKESEQAQSSTGKELTITATSAYDETKATLSDGRMVWTVRDRISVVSETTNDTFLLTDGAGTPTGTFSGFLSEADSYICLYPQDDAAMINGSGLSINIPETQIWADGSFYGSNIAVAELSDYSSEVVFKNVCGLLQLDVTGTGTVTKVVITDKGGKSIAGRFNAPLSGIGTDRQELESVSCTSSVTIDCGSGVALDSTKPTGFVAVVAPGAFADGFDATFFGGADEEINFSTTEDNRVYRSGRRIMPAEDIHFSSSFTLTNPAVSAYLNQADDYDTSDYSYTKVKEYVEMETSYRKDQPFPVTVSWDPVETSSVKVFVSESADYADAFTFDVPRPSDTSYDVYNLIPGKKYYYKAVATKNNVETVAGEGSFNTLGHLRMIRCNSSNNIRDLGGWESEVFTRPDGTPKQIRYGKIYRGANIDGISKSDRRLMTGPMIGISYELELRTTKFTSSPFGLDAYYDATHGLDNIYYQNIKDTDKYARMFEKVVKRLKEGHTIYFHCAAGADRTGTLAFMLEGVLGVKENDLVKDYELTSFGWSGNRTRTTEYYNFTGMMNAIKAYEGATLQQKFYNNLLSWGVPAETIDWYIDFMLE